MDRFYITTKFLQKIDDFATVPVAFSNHFGILITVYRSVADVASICTRLVEEYEGWKLRHVYLDDRSRWWNDVAKHKMKQFFKRESFLLNTRISNEKKYFYGKMLEWMDKQNTGQPTFLDKQMIKSRLIEMENQRLTHLGSNIDDFNLVQGEMINIFQVAAEIKRLESSGNSKIRDGDIVITDSVELRRLAFEHFSNTFQPDKPDTVSSPSDNPLNYITKFLSRRFNKADYRRRAKVGAEPVLLKEVSWT